MCNKPNYFFVAVLLLPLCSGVTAQQTATSSADDDTIETVIVTGRAQRLYRVSESDTGKLPADPFSSAQMITTINDQLIRDQGARDAQDIYRNISGVSLFSYAGVTARGFRQEEIFFDGLRGDPYVGFNVPQLFNIERVDFLKGPAGMLYGPGAPGGLFNYVTKKPTENFYGRASGVWGDENRVGGSFEINGALPVDGLAGRLGIFYEDREMPRDNAEQITGIYDLGLRMDLDYLTATLQATRYVQDQPGNRLRGVPVDDQGNFLGDRRWNHNEASDFLDLESDNIQLQLEGVVGGSLSWDFTLRQTESEQAQKYHEPIQLLDIEALLMPPTDGTPDLVARQFRDQFREEEQLSLGANVIWQTQFDRIDNRLLVGYERFDGDETAILGGFNTTPDMIGRFLTGSSLPGDILPLSIRNPLYGITRPENYAVQFIAPRVTEQKRSGAYLLNEATHGRWTIVGGLRFDQFEDIRDEDIFDDDDVSARLGVIYKPREQLAFFTQWAESYEPQSSDRQVPGTGGPFSPTTGAMFEIGTKARWLDGRVQTSTAVYEIVRENILQADPLGDPDSDGVDNFIAFGEVTSRGFELDITADLTRDWVITGAYAFNSTKITRDNGELGILNSSGKRFANAPKHQLGFWTRYQVHAFDTAFAFGGDYVDEQISLSDQKVKSSVIFDASIIWQPGPIDVLFRIDNLFDETYAESGFLARTGHFPGEPRSFFVEVSREW